jgi:hypothetical protein
MAAETRKEQIGFDAYDILKQAWQFGSWLTPFAEAFLSASPQI